MKIIFLDIDGVLGTNESMYRYFYRRDTSLSEKIGLHNNLAHELSYYSTTLLSDVVKQTDANIVISSTWRYNWSPQDMEKIMRYFGFEHTGKVMDSTPSLPGKPRGLEVQKWLDNNKSLDIEDFIIIDDSSDMEHLSHRLVQTQGESGFLLKHKMKAIKMLTKKEESEWTKQVLVTE